VTTEVCDLLGDKCNLAKKGNLGSSVQLKELK